MNKLPKIGPTFGDEVIAAGLGGLPFSWGDDGLIQGDENLSSKQRKTLEDVAKAHNPDSVISHS
ncbi:hypothetical protein ATY75_12280 [Rhizobium sp. N122]|uniref:hypothetical protein n=1 Tax=Rhizobium sp. N122 TaxID=1764272 RepID=UPI000B5A7C4C|nr:hypothetical protein [Rhizobium sp. N122]OWV62594.1 hypothetical protein ATY75_12280 [Rhizobium sp. N122]